jgi:hypothetical protein
LQHGSEQCGGEEAHGVSVECLKSRPVTENPVTEKNNDQLMEAA